jgi:hypothetical protein
LVLHFKSISFCVVSKNHLNNKIYEKINPIPALNTIYYY